VYYCDINAKTYRKRIYVYYTHEWKEKTIERLTPGLESHLLAFAAANRMAHINKAELILDAETGFQYDHVYTPAYLLGLFSIWALPPSAVQKPRSIGPMRRLILGKYRHFLL
jgi:hypothetical protein